MGVSVGGGEPGSEVTPGLWGGARALGLGIRRDGGLALEAEGTAERMEVGLE